MHEPCLPAEPTYLDRSAGAEVDRDRTLLIMTP